MGKVNILVVEDESIVAKDIERSLIKLGFGVVGIASTFEKAVELATEHSPDLVLMDIMLKGEKSGIEAAEEIRKTQSIPVIYLTAYADDSTLKKAKITEPYGYILKPFKEIDLQTNIEMALYKHSKDAEVARERDYLYNIVEGKQQTNSKMLFVKSNSRLVRLNITDIYFVEALKDYVVIHTSDSRYTIHSTMKDLLGKLPSEEFVRVHRSFIVRIDKIATIEQPNIVLENDKKLIPIGGSYKDELQQMINLI